MRWVKGGEVSPSGLVEKLGMKPQAVSNQLQRLSYRIVDPCVIDRRRVHESPFTRYRTLRLE